MNTAPILRRQFDRWQFDIPCRFRYNATIYEGKIIDLSLGGGFVECSTYPPAGSEVDMEFSSGAKLITVKAVVRHCGWYLLGFRNGDGFGFEFKAVSAENVMHLRKLVQSSTQPAENKLPLER